MSGLYFTVWDVQHNDLSAILSTTPGGYPHLSAVFAPRNSVSHSDLITAGANIFKEIAAINNGEVEVVGAFVSQFYTDTEKKIQRNDVLLQLSQKDVANFEAALDKHYYGVVNGSNVAKRYPVCNTPQEVENLSDKKVWHVTYRTDITYEDAARKVAAHLNENTAFPYKIKVTGFTTGNKTRK
jgi:hypothetical protein